MNTVIYYLLKLRDVVSLLATLRIVKILCKYARKSVIQIPDFLCYQLLHSIRTSGFQKGGWGKIS